MKGHGRSGGQALLIQDDLPGKVDLSSPRMLAAMKLMGVEQSDLEVRKSGSQTERSHQEQRRMEVLEGRRQNLIREVQRKANTLQEEHVDAILLSEAGSNADKESSVFLDLRSRIDMGRERDKAILERKVAGELKKREVREAFESKLDATNQRVKEAKKEEEKDSSNRMEVKQRKIEEKAAAAAQEEVANRRRVVEKLKEAAQRTQKQLDVRAKKLEEAREERMKKMSQVAERSGKHELEDQESKLQRYEQVLERGRELEAWKGKQREEALKASEERSARFMQKMQRVEDSLKEQLAEREKACMETLEKLTKARQAATQAKVDIVEKVKLHNEKEAKKWAENRSRVAEARREKVTAWKQELASKGEKSQTVREQYLASTLGEKVASRALYREIVDMNKARLQRSDDCSRDLILAKIQSGRAKLDAEKEQRREASRYRSEAMRETMTNRALVEELSIGATPRKVNQVLQDLGMTGMTLASEPKSKEGDEAAERS
mmetsp:Transcript_35708/g.83591  ORF Transcript_35708/g.83591 Transcript_35708/m.83591 type:complete len:493 (-) Transcript_35708:135-1613(-)|eukprot:CAMPEP_0178389526 /NCGR_PEP_ID=MMETSP0689_2-20121128/10165_1 /TAXON_ID=160604 /ORGANISM="Amphidinium massartii, Strain CS-259" /LENGTH=492 /DNA_ID=CAMNT_0020009985 /DNA_START=38 /DNA_END=1516 /DNA_ORIENTATION=-